MCETLVRGGVVIWMLSIVYLRLETAGGNGVDERSWDDRLIEPESSSFLYTNSLSPSAGESGSSEEGSARARNRIGMISRG